MKTPRAIGIATACLWVLGLTSVQAQEQSPKDDWEVMVQALEQIQPLPGESSPRYGSFYTLQRGGSWPPLPANIMNLPFWNLGGGFYILDDRKVDYTALRAEAESVGELEIENSMGMMAMSMGFDSAWGAGVYLTNFSATPPAIK